MAKVVKNAKRKLNFNVSVFSVNRIRTCPRVLLVIVTGPTPEVLDSGGWGALPSVWRFGFIFGVLGLRSSLHR